MAVCRSCGEENPERAKFCLECGAPLAEAAPALALEERKVVSVLFCDLVGFTGASERQDPEDVRARLRSFHARLRQEIERYGGTVEKFVGDAVMAVFGAPVTHEDDAERAVRAGLRILDAISDLNAADPQLDLQVRVGINTGEAVVALGAHPEKGEGIVAGDIVNTAARIQGVAPVNGVAVSEPTRRATSRVFEFGPLAPVSVKGKAEPLLLWQAKTARARFGTDVGRHETPFVGRELEKPLLIGTFERAAQQRSVQLVTIVGEPGVGKSRLVAELFAYTDGEPGLFRWKQGRCLPYGERITFWALGEIVKAEAGILESDSAEVSLEKLGAAVPPDERDRQWLLERLAPLVGVESASPAERPELFTAWRRFIESLAAARPSVLVFEDLHWADGALLDFLEHLVGWSQDIPLFVLCTARPELYEQRPGWATGLRNAQTINLAPLSDQETGQLVSYLLSGTVLSANLERVILERAGGNPLYAEEFVRFLADSGGRDAGDALDDSALPESVQALIAARLDTLSPERKGLLQDAAVVGKVFWTGALAEMAGTNEQDIELALHDLARKELVRPLRTSSMEDEHEYSFWHLLVRDVAYAQSPRADRVRRHRAAAVWLERKAGERVEDLAEVLAHHYLQAVELAEATGDTEQAAQLVVPARRFLALAGERALGLDTVQAEARLARALELTPAEDPEQPALLVRWADATLQAGRPREAAEALERALAVFRERGDQEAAGRALTLLSRVAKRLGEARHLELAAEAVSVLEQAGPSAALVDAYAQLSHVGHDPETIIAAAVRALSLADTLVLPVPALALSERGLARVGRGERDGLAEMEAALALLIEQGAGRETGLLMNTLAVARLPLEGFAATLSAYEQGIAFCAERGLAEPQAVLESNSVDALAAIGRVEQALELAGRLAAVAEARGDLYALMGLRAVQAVGCAERGETEAARAHLDGIVTAARESGSLDTKVHGLASAAIAMLADAPEEAGALLAELESTPDARHNANYPQQLPGMMRTALAAGDSALAAKLPEGLEPTFPLNEHALCAARAQLFESTGELETAVALHADAAERWRRFAYLPEQAYSLLGQGRCLVALGDPAAEQPLHQAAELFASMGYRPALTETETLLERTTAAAP